MCDTHCVVIDNVREVVCGKSVSLDKDLVVASQKYLAKEYKSEVERWGYIDPVRWNAFYNWINENKLADTEIPENTGFTNDYLPE